MSTQVKSEMKTKQKRNDVSKKGHDMNASGNKGITFSGDTFIVPTTHDMVQTLFDPSIRKSHLEIIVLLCLISNVGIFWFSNRINIFIGLYIFWRLCYNFGIGYLLCEQSNRNTLVKWAEKSRAFDSESTTLLSRFIRAEIKSQRGEDYDISSYPIEFNTWLIFRKFVDLILMSDFTTFICLVVACSIDGNFQFLDQTSWLRNSRFVIGSILIVFNYWVKVNAHNTIKDYAWYWGDFFFRQINNEELIFDGVFEMVPHPMYSVGYVGYYGFALISKSYTVLVVAIFGHFLQMIFLHYIENPHIDKIYGPSKNEINVLQLLKLKDLKNFDNIKPLVGLYNFNILRASDVINLGITITYGLVIPLFAVNAKSVTPSTLSWLFNYPISYMFLLTIGTKVLESSTINIALILQSNFKYFTKWYLSNDISVEKSLNNWAIFYNSLINLTYSSLFGLNLYQFLVFGWSSKNLLFNDWTYLRIFIGVLLILTQAWINSSIIDLIGYFGWFYGDFFIPKSQRIMTHLTKAGVYRYLNNPEQIFGVCGVMGLFIISPSIENLTCCILWVANNFFRINFIEKAHMVKVYGEQEVLQDSGVTKTFKKHLIPDVIQRRMSDSRMSDPRAREEFLKNRNRRKSSLTESLDNFIKELKSSNKKLSTQNIIELSQSLRFENSDYKITINGLTESEEATENESYLPKYITVGTPIEISWTSPSKSHSKNDWIGLYKIAQTSYSRNKTLLSSSGRWTWCKENEGSFVFDKEKLFWGEGLYEFRYHSDGKHDVSYISEPFEIKIAKLVVPTTEDETVLFSNQMKSQIFDKILTLESIDDSISKAANEADDIVQVYDLLSYLISKSTDIKISSKLFLNNDDEAKGLTIKKLVKKLIHSKKILEELSYNDDWEKKEI